MVSDILGEHIEGFGGLEIFNGFQIINEGQGMDTAHRRKEIISILSARRHTTSRELAEEFGVSIRTIQNDILLLSLDYPIYTKQGEGGGYFIAENYKPYANTLTPTELEILCRLYGKLEGNEKEILLRVIYKYGADKLKI